jgi:cation-transporting ATPase E
MTYALEVEQGLSQAQVQARKAQGQSNRVRFQSGRSYLQIVRQNAFTFINSVLFCISAVLIAMGRSGDGLVTAGLVLFNVVIGVYQQARARYKLERIVLLSRPRATVLREGVQQQIDPDEIVLGDTLIAYPGDQILVDGRVVSGRAEIDESLLTGESERLVKDTGSSLYSGSFCVSGELRYLAEKVGEQSLIHQMTAGARAARQVKTPLQQEIDFVIRILVLLVTPLGILLGLSYALQKAPIVEGVRMAAVIVALVPQGLFFMTTVAYAMGMLRLAGKGALIQEPNAIESTSHVNLLCLDKTGTLTSNRMQMHALYPAQAQDSSQEERLRRLLGDFAASVSGGSRTTAALQDVLGGRACSVVEEAPFSSQRRWSGLTLENGGGSATYVLAAPDVFQKSLSARPDLRRQIETWIHQGLRVLLFAGGKAAPLWNDDHSEPVLPQGLAPLGLVSFREELRPEAMTTLQHFTALDVALKIISGDDPHTVAALARQIGLVVREPAVHGADLDGLDEQSFATLVERSSIFGRITPQQKERLVRHFRERGRYVAMIGDGVNDVLSMKQAQVSVAMQSGCDAVRGVADIVLLQDSFAALPVALSEGQRIVQGMEDVLRLLLTRTFYVTLLVVAAQLAGAPFPVTPKHNSLLALLTVGIPILAIAAWARPGQPPRSLLRETMHFVFPAAISIAVFSLSVFLFYWSRSGQLEMAQTALTITTVFCGLLLVPFVEPPTHFWEGGDRLSGDRRPSLLALGLLGGLVVILATPLLRNFFELTFLEWRDYGGIVLLVVVWAWLVRWMWRKRLFERLLSMP